MQMNNVSFDGWDLMYNCIIFSYRSSVSIKIKNSKFKMSTPALKPSDLNSGTDKQKDPLKCVKC